MSLLAHGKRAACRAAALVALALPSACHSQVAPAGAIAVEVPESLRKAPGQAELLRFEDVRLPAGEAVIVQVFAVPPGREPDTEMPSEDYLGAFAGEARAEEGPGSPPRSFAVAVPLRLPGLIERAGAAPLEVILVPVDRTGRRVSGELTVGKVRASAE